MPEKCATMRDMTLDDTWFSQDLPVLVAAIRILDERQGAVTVSSLAESMGRDRDDVHRSVVRLADTYLKVSWAQRGSRPFIKLVSGSTAEARRAVGQWPNPDALVERLITELERRVETATDDEERTRWQKLLDGAKGVGSNALSQLVAQAVWQGGTGLM